MKNLSTIIAKSYKKNENFRLALNVASGQKVYTNYKTGSGKWSNTTDRFPQIYLFAWGIDHEIGNDAPRGGKAGNFIQLTKKGLAQTKLYRSELATKLAIEKHEATKAVELLIEKKATSTNDIIANIANNQAYFTAIKKELANLKLQGNKEEWHKIANQAVQTACKNDYSIGWSNIYKLIL